MTQIAQFYRKQQQCRANTNQEGVLCFAVVGNSNHRGGLDSTDIHTEKEYSDIKSLCRSDSNGMTQ
jgi:hypothetical protein